MTAGARAQACDHHTAAGAVCGATTDVRLYANGPRCPTHTPAALAGRPEPSGQYCAPNRCYCGRCDSGQTTTREHPMPTTDPTDDLAAEIKTAVLQNIRRAAAHAPRSQQREIGMSEVGSPCTRRIAYRLLDWDPKPNSGLDPWASVQGTAVHAWIEEVYRAENDRLGRERYLIEATVRVPTRWGPLVGHSDLFDRDLGAVIDWKHVSPSRINHYKARGPGPVYRTQAHLYGYGQQLAGEDVRHVAIVFLPRAVTLTGAHVWTEPYDQAVAETALQRLDLVRESIHALDPEAHPDRWAMFPPADAGCRFCPWFLAGSTDPSRGCPGAPDADVASSVASLIA